MPYKIHPNNCKCRSCKKNKKLGNKEKKVTITTILAIIIPFIIIF